MLILCSSIGYSGWWNYSWDNAVSFNMTEASGVNLQDYTFNITFNPQAWKMQGACQDIRIINVTNSVSLPYNLTGCNDTRMNISFKDSILASAVNLYKAYYNNPTAANAAVPYSQVVLFYDDFNDGVLNTSKWTANSTTEKFSEENGYMKMNVSGGYVFSNGLGPSFLNNNQNYSISIDRMFSPTGVNYLADTYFSQNDTVPPSRPTLSTAHFNFDGYNAADHSWIDFDTSNGNGTNYVNINQSATGFTQDRWYNFKIYPLTQSIKVWAYDVANGSLSRLFQAPVGIIPNQPVTISLCGNMVMDFRGGTMFQ
jgi:hypothetical protein